MSSSSSKLDQSQRELVRNILAASSTTSFCVALMNPIDVLRIKWQTQPLTTNNTASLIPFISSQIRQCANTRDFISKLFLPGIGVNAMSVATSSGLRLGFYPLTKELACTLTRSEEANSIIMFASGFISGAMGFFLATPFFTAKIKAQSHFASKSGWGYLVETCRAQSNPFRGSSILVARGALFSAGFSLGYDGTKTRLRKRGVVEGPLVHALGSISAALIATGLAAPFDVILTKFQTSASSNLRSSIQSIYFESGPRAFFRGWSLFFARVAPLFLIQLPLYEQVRKALGMEFM